MTGSLSLILVAAGSSSRMGGDDKVWSDVAGKPLILHSIERLSGSVDELTVVCKPGDETRMEDILEMTIASTIPWRVTQGGTRRQDSVLNGLRTVGDAARVAIHDAARPLAGPSLLARVVEASRETGGAVPAVPVPDTLKRVSAGAILETVDRSDLWAVQTPQVFERELLEGAFSLDCWIEETATDEASMIERMGGVVRIVRGDPRNLKVTTPEDLEMVRAVLAATEAGSMGRG